MKRKVTIPFVSWRDGRPRFDPGANIRELGFASMNLRHPEGGPIDPAALKTGTRNKGAWFTAAEAMTWSERFQKDLAKLQEAKAPRPDMPRPSRATAPRNSYPLCRLIEDWKRSGAFRDDLAPKTQEDYKSKMNVLASLYPEIWAAEIDAMKRPVIYGLYENLRTKRSLTMARGIIMVLSSAFTWGLNHGKFRILETNPCLRLKLKQPPPRLRVASPLELDTLIRIADAVGRHDMGDCFTLAVWSGQRQGDRLGLQLLERNSRRLELRQSKTGALVSLPRAAELDKRLRVSEERRRAAGIVSSYLVLFENTWRPFNHWTYRQYFSEIRIIAANGLWRTGEGALVCPVNTPFKHLKSVVGTGPAAGDCIVEPCPSLKDFTEEDFRDTAVTWLALGGATIPEICSVTGHSLEAANSVLKHYLALNADMADSAIEKMVAWYENSRKG